jgi:hypothetical protein
VQIYYKHKKKLLTNNLLNLEQRAKGNLPEIQIVDKKTGDISEMKFVEGETIRRIIYKGDDLTSADVGENVSKYASNELRTKEIAIAADRQALIDKQIKL